MARFTCFLALALLGVVAASELSTFENSDNESRLGIYNGKSTTIKKHPYLAAIKYSGSFLCAATIISKNWLITSANCADGFSASDLKVVVGSNYGSRGGKTFSVSTVVIHPNFGDASLLDNNYALIKISGSFTFSKKIKAATLPTTAAKDGSSAVITGWGNTKQDASSKMLQGQTNVMNLDDCAKSYSSFDIQFTDSLFCVYNKGQASPCNGDWADPITEGNILHSIFLAVATEGACTASAYPAIGANIYNAVSWIQNQTGIADY